MKSSREAIEAMRKERVLTGAQLLNSNIKRILDLYDGDVSLAVEAGAISERYAQRVLGYEAAVQDEKGTIGETSDWLEFRLERLFGGCPPVSFREGRLNDSDSSGILAAVRAPSTPCWAPVGVTHSGQKSFVATGGVSSIAQKFENSLRNNGPGWIWNS